MTMLKPRTAFGEVMSERSELPDSVQIEVAATPSNRHTTTWMAMFQGKLAMPA